MIEDEKFNKCVNEFKKLPIERKQEIVVNDIKKTLAFIEKLKLDANIKTGFLYNKEISDNFNDEQNDEDFVEAMFVYIHSIQESLAEYIEFIAKFAYKKEDL